MRTFFAATVLAAAVSALSAEVEVNDKEHDLRELLASILEDQVRDFVEENNVSLSEARHHFKNGANIDLSGLSLLERSKLLRNFEQGTTIRPNNSVVSTKDHDGLFYLDQVQSRKNPLHHLLHPSDSDSNYHYSHSSSSSDSEHDHVHDHVHNFKEDHLEDDPWFNQLKDLFNLSDHSSSED